MRSRGRSTNGWRPRRDHRGHGRGALERECTPDGSPSATGLDELQGHGRTADIDRPLRYEQLADDVAALVKQIGVDRADVYGYSLGGGVALQVAIRHPDLVRKLVVASGAFDSKGWQPGLLDMIKSMKPEQLAGSPWQKGYARVAPQPENWNKLVEKVKELDSLPQHWPPPSELVYGNTKQQVPSSM